jgi:AcrR family transcriptional regulator
MGSVDTSTPKPGLRERKKQQTRETIERVALQLFAERGYDETTLAEIAEAADISPRTIFSYFQSKEDILFCEEPSHLDEIAQILEQRPAGTTTVDALRDFIASQAPPDEQAILRKKIVAANPDLQMKLRARIGQLEGVLTDSIAKDLDAAPGDVRPALIAASMIAAFAAVRDRIEAAPGAPDLDEMRQIVDEVLEFLQGGLRALQDH